MGSRTFQVKAKFIKKPRLVESYPASQIDVHDIVKKLMKEVIDKLDDV